MTVLSFRTLVATSVVLLAMLAEELDWALEDFNLSFEEALELDNLKAFSPCLTSLTLIAVSLILSRHFKSDPRIRLNACPVNIV